MEEVLALLCVWGSCCVTLSPKGNPQFRNTQNPLQYLCFQNTSVEMFLVTLTMNTRLVFFFSFRTSQMLLVRATSPCCAAVLMSRQSGTWAKMTVSSMGSSSPHHQGSKFHLVARENLSQGWKKRRVAKPLLLTRWTPRV